MKKFIIATLFLLITIMGYSQIKVFENGNVSIKHDNQPLSKFVLNHQGDSDYEAFFYGPSKSFGGTINIYSEPSGGSHVASIYMISRGGSGYNYGVKAHATVTSPASGGRAYGVFGCAGNSSNGWNYGVYVRLYGPRNGAGIFGTNATQGDIEVPGQYGGYFRGSVKVEGILWANQVTESDEKFKTNIYELNEEESISKLSVLRPVEYNLKQRTIEAKIASKTDSVQVVNYYESDSPLLQKKQIGLIAQELQKVYPELVYESQSGDLGIDYTGLIPILIKTIQAQQKKIEEIEKEILELKNTDYEIRR